MVCLFHSQEETIEISRYVKVYLLSASIPFVYGDILVNCEFG